MTVAAQRYYAATQADSHLLNGTEYVSRPKPYVQGSPFFLLPSPQPGSLRYDGFDFVAVPMLYDCHLDRVVVLPPSRAIALQLVPEKVASFTLGGHHFVRLTTDSVANPQVRTGFYDLLVDGPARLLARRTRKLSERPTQFGMEGYYDETIRYVLQRDTDYYVVSRLRDITAIFPTKKADLQRFARSRHLSFREEGRAASLTALVAYYNTLVR
ncbi:hypothetical protein A0257_15810 [Hymenobacter psoromatis]|nr:hypothetical protein A0257_15810 [Hymenobacter psoromatis]